MEVLRALQLATSEISPVSIPDRINGLTQDKIIPPLRSELLLLTCRSNNNPACRDLQPVRSLIDLWRRLHLPSLRTAQWDRRGLTLLDDWVYIPDVSQARLHVLQSRHDSLLAGHPGVTKTKGLISCNYIWPGLRRDVEVYIEGCAVCQQTRSSKQPEHGHLRLLELPERPWQHMTMDFIENLPHHLGMTPT